ncbi:MAG: tyrosine-type recombinase/integrase [Proteobacteria bacterium]|nr:tyrosine-type recombinase/integrase [Pseudomonadota bacterium]
MTTFKLKYVHEFRDRHGHVRRYFRGRDGKRMPLPGLPGSEEFMAAYAAALEGQGRPEIGAKRTKAGTVNAAVVAYYQSAAFRSLAKSTQDTYRGILENFRGEHGEKGVATLERRHIEKMISHRADTPAAANNLLGMLRTLMQFAVTHGFRKDDPTAGVKNVRSRSEGYHTWTEAEISTFEARHEIGTRARLAMSLLLYTAQRRSDVVRMGRQHIREGVLTLRQQKTGTLVEIPVHPELQAVLDATPSEHLTFLVTDYGKPFTAAGFGNLFRDWCTQAGLPQRCSSHGLRKAASRRLAEAGCTAHEIMAITGHKTLTEVTRYTAAVDRRRLGKSAIQKITTRTSTGNPE